MAGWIATALFLLDLTIKVIALGVVPKNRRPSSGMAWLLLILIDPVLGDRDLPGAGPDPARAAAP